MIYRQGRYNLSATIFVPWDCSNNCHFCTSKATYRDTSAFDIWEVAQSIDALNKNPCVKEFVLTGGEPFADLNHLRFILSWCLKPVYINTTLPSDTLVDAVRIIDGEDKIRGVNISRHISCKLSNIASAEDLDLIDKPIRINTMFSNDDISNVDKLEELICEFGKKRRDINIREDYRHVTLDTLKSRNKLFSYLCERYDYLASECCMVCNTDYFSVDDSFVCSYHRGLERSSVIFGDKCYVNDIIVAQDGKIYKDWDRIEDAAFTSWAKGDYKQ